MTHHNMNSTVNFSDLALIEPIQRAVLESGYTKPTPIQVQAIPRLLEGQVFARMRPNRDRKNGRVCPSNPESVGAVSPSTAT